MTIRSLTLSSLVVVIAVASFTPTSAQPQDRDYYARGYSLATTAWNQNITLFNSCLQRNDWSRLHSAQHGYQKQLLNDWAPLMRTLTTQPSSSSAYRGAFCAIQSYGRGVVDSCNAYDLDRYCNSLNMTPEQRNIFRNYMHSLIVYLNQLSNLSYTAVS